jgi:hypothetical protein
VFCDLCLVFGVWWLDKRNIATKGEVQHEKNQSVFNGYGGLFAF